MTSARISYRHPRDELVEVMSRMYGRHLNTSFGGNASIIDTEGTIWMTPKGKDKGALQRDEMAYRKSDSEWQGNYPPSSEWPFHTSIYKVRPDAKAILHAHSQTLVAFSVANQLPNTYTLSQAAHVCGNVALAPYAMPGTNALASSIVEQIKTHDCVIMANHGVVVVAPTMMEAYQKFEALEFCARAQVRARLLGGQPLSLSPDDLTAQSESTTVITRGEHRNTPLSTRECELRALIVKYVQRSYEQGLVHSTSGAMSAKLTAASFLITPSGVDRRSIRPEDIILVEFPSLDQAKSGRGATYVCSQQGLVPSRAWAVHNSMYQSDNNDTQVVLQAHPFHITAFCMTWVQFNSAIIPESYMVLRNVGRIPFRHSLDGTKVVQGFAEKPHCNVLLVDNDGVMIRGETCAQVFDRLEVLEATANVVLECKSLGSLHPMTKEQVQEIDEHWFHEKNPNKKQRTSYQTHEIYGMW